jgi:hypothetical protein
MRKKVSKRKRKLFNPDKIATAIDQNLNRDLAMAKQMYRHGVPSQLYYQQVQQKNTLKKYVPCEADMSGVEEVTYKNFLNINEHMREVNEQFRKPRNLSHKHLSDHELILKRARALMHWTLGHCRWGDLCEHVSNSGGVTQGVSFKDTSEEAKFTWPISGTDAAVRLFRQYLIDNTQLSRAIDVLNGQRQDVEKYEVVDSSRATTVPKTIDKLRMIAIEPTLNMFFQQSLMQLMYKRMKMVGLDVERLPTVHRNLALEGSITAKLATIDFSSASDCVSIELLRYLLPSSWFYWINQVRSPYMEIQGEKIELHMVSTMGNAGTFPLESLVFWCIGVGTIMNRTQKNRNSVLSEIMDRRSMSVFGDDCILPTVDATLFIETAETVGFMVNKEKSFYHEDRYFRESCGGDYHHGVNVRPVCLKAPSSNRLSNLEPWLYIILNLFLKKYISYFGELQYVYDKTLLGYLFGLFAKNKLKVKLVPPQFPDDAGLKTSDWHRLERCYNIIFDKVALSDQGVYHFKYCKFQYWDKRTRNDSLRLALWLKKPVASKEAKVRKQFPIRKKGGYVVARGFSSFWTLN